MAKLRTNPITVNNKLYDPLEIYRSPLFRTMAGYKLLSGTFLLCGAVAVPALLYTGQTSGYTGAAAIGVASILPLTLQTIFVPHYVARISLTPEEFPQTKGQKRTLLDSLTRQTRLNIEHFTLFGYLTSSVESVADLSPHKSRRWINWKSKGGRGRGYYVDKAACGPIMRKIGKMMDKPDDPESWKIY